MSFNHVVSLYIYYDVLTQNQNSTSDPKDIESIFDTISYKKGASIIHMLEKLVGEQTIRSGLSRYIHILREHFFSPKIRKCCHFLTPYQRFYERWLNKRIYKTEMKCWAVLGRAVGAAEKKTLPTAISMQLFGVVFSTFCGQKKIIIFLKTF